MIPEVCRALKEEARGDYQRALAEGRKDWTGRLGANGCNAAIYRAARINLIARAQALLPGRLDLARVLAPTETGRFWRVRLVYTLEGVTRDVHTAKRLYPGPKPGTYTAKSPLPPPMNQ